MKKLAIEEKDDIKADLNTRQSIERLLKLLEMYKILTEVMILLLVLGTIIRVVSLTLDRFFINESGR